MFSKIRDKFFNAIETILRGQSSKEIAEQTKSQTERIIIEAKLDAQKQWVKDTLSERQKDIDIQQESTKDIQKEKELFRMRMYQATSSLKKDSELSKHQTK